MLVCCRTQRGGTSWHQSATSYHHPHHHQLSVHDQLSSVLSSPLGAASHPAARTCLADRSPLIAVNAAVSERSLSRPALARRAGVQPSSMRLARKKPLHIKKPLNAFMLFMKEMRAKVVDECTLKESAAINQVLGRKVQSKGRKTVVVVVVVLLLFPIKIFIHIYICSFIRRSCRVCVHSRPIRGIGGSFSHLQIWGVIPLSGLTMSIG